MFSTTALFFLFAVTLLLQSPVSSQEFDVGAINAIFDDSPFASSSSVISSARERGDFGVSQFQAQRQVRRNKRNVRRAIRTAQAQVGVCKPAICYILDGSDEVTTLNWETQTSFVQLLSAIIGQLDGSTFSAVEFTGRNFANVISDLTSFTDFAIDVAAALPTGLIRPNLRGAVQYCTNTLTASAGGSAFQKIVTLADLDTAVRGKNAAVSIARAWDGDDATNPNPFNDMCGGVIGSTSKSFWVKLAGGVNTDVRRVASWDLLIDIIVDLIEDICPGVDLGN